jgi:V/A-type H+-transporting ATPase subunit I
VLRPQAATWFEVLAARDDVAVVLEAIARTGAAELQARPQSVAAQPLHGLASGLSAHAELEHRYGPYWPAEREPSPVSAAPAAVLEQGNAQIRAWAGRAEPIIQSLQRLERERGELVLWQRVLEVDETALPGAVRLAPAGPLFVLRLLVFPDSRIAPLPEEIVARHFEIEGRAHLLALGPEEAIQLLCRQTAGKAQAHEVPDWLFTGAGDAKTLLAARLAEADAELARLRAELAQLNATHALRRTLGDMERVRWLARHAGAIESGTLFTWITGWTSDGARIAAALERRGAPAVARFPARPENLTPPLLLRNPWWARPFEIFSRALGMPARNEADPTQLLAIIVPLLFGYMFGDAGQGLVLIAAGMLLARRWPLARLLIAGGISAVAFGFVFGSFFSLEHVLPPLWLRPLESPLPLLVVPLVGGAALLMLGLAINGIESYWRGAIGEWLAGEAGVLIAYLGIVLAFAHPAGSALALAGALLHVAGSLWTGRRAAAIVTGLLTLLERLAQISINTLSFARVGAFALAHAGLSAAIVALAEAAGSAWLKLAALVLGNAAIIALEVLVVSVQTTRLVLFEFFTRFFVGSGRVFQPLPPPPFTSQEA